MVFSMLALYLTGVLLAGLVIQYAALRALAGFRSDERKKGQYRADSGQGRSTKLPMSGGPALIVTLLAGLAAASFVFPDPGEVWRPALAIVVFGAVGLVDDVMKYRGGGMPPKWRFIACVLAALVSAVPLVAWTGGAAPLLSLGAGAVLLFLTAVGCDFSDGIDGLAATLGVIAAVSMASAAALLNAFPTAGLFGLFAVATLGFYVFNRPSAWTKAGTVPRKAKAYLGDSGALALGGGLAAVTLWNGLTIPFLPAAGPFLLNALAAAWQAEVLTKLIYRPHGKVLIYGSQWAPHIEFPLPLLAAPLHHHFELAGWNRLSIVRLFAAVGLGMGLGGSASVLGLATMNRGMVVNLPWIHAMVVVGYGVAVLSGLILWRLVTLNSTFFLAVEGSTVAVCCGAPFTLKSRPYYRPVRLTALKASDLTADERLWLYRPMPRPDAIEMAARLLSAHGMKEDAAVMASMLPEAARKVRLADLEPSPE